MKKIIIIGLCLLTATSAYATRGGSWNEFSRALADAFTAGITGLTTISMSGQLTNTVADGTPPMVITSGTKVTNLNADKTDGVNIASLTDTRMLRYNSTGTTIENSSIIEASGALSGITTLSASGDITNNGDINTTNVRVNEILGADILIDGGLEAWDDADTLTNWNDGDGGGPGGSIAREDTIIHGGSYSCKMISAVGGSRYIAQIKTGLTVGDTYKTKAWLRDSDNTASFQLILMNGVISVDATQIYNFTTDVWVDGTGVGGAVNPAVDIGPDNMSDTGNVTTSFVQYTFENFTIPVSGKIVPVFALADDSKTAYIDDITMQKVTAPTYAELFNLESSQDPASYDVNDVIFKIRNTGGAGQTWFTLYGDATITTQGNLEVGGDLVVADNLSMNSGFIQGSCTTGITASTTQTQGNGELSNEINVIATCANPNDTVTLPAAVAGRRVVVINNGAQTAKIFPASGDNLGAGADTATTLGATNNVVFQAYDATNWEVI
jgi:hypothetical protein